MNPDCLDFAFDLLNSNEQIAFSLSTGSPYLSSWPYHDILVRAGGEPVGLSALTDPEFSGKLYASAVLDPRYDDDTGIFFVVAEAEATNPFKCCESCPLPPTVALFNGNKMILAWALAEPLAVEEFSMLRGGKVPFWQAYADVPLDGTDGYKLFCAKYKTRYTFEALNEAFTDDAWLKMVGDTVK